MRKPARGVAWVRVVGALPRGVGAWVLAVGVLGALVPSGSAQARGGPGGPDAVARGVGILHALSYWDRERLVAPVADQPQKLWVAANFTVVVSGPGGGGVISSHLAVSDPGASGSKPTKRETSPVTIRDVVDARADGAVVGLLRFTRDLRWHGGTLAKGDYGVALRVLKGLAMGLDRGALTLEVMPIGPGTQGAEIGVPAKALGQVLDAMKGEALPERHARAAILDWAAIRLLLADRLAVAVAKLLEGGKPQPQFATNLNSSRSNIYRTVEIAPEPVPALEGAGGVVPVAVKRVDKATPLLMRVTEGKADEALVGVIRVDREVVAVRKVDGKAIFLLRPGRYEVVLFGAARHVPAGRTELILAVFPEGGAAAGGILLDAGAVARAVVQDAQGAPEGMAETFRAAVLLHAAAAALAAR